MQVTPDAVAGMAKDYTAAWNSGSADAVASFYAPDGEIVINRGDPWSGRDRVRDMAAGFFADATISGFRAPMRFSSGALRAMTHPAGGP